MSQIRRFRVPTALIAALAAILVLAATASAETRTGEATSPVNGAIPSEADLVKATASYDTTAGTLDIKTTTLAEPQAKNKAEEPSKFQVMAFLLSVPGPCALTDLIENEFSLPALALGSPYSEGIVHAGLLSSSGEITLPAAKSVAGTTTSLSVTSGALANQGFNCVLVGITGETEKGEQLGESNLLALSLSVPPAAPTPVAAPAPAPPAPAPAALSIAKSKPLKLKAGKSKTVKIKVTNTGATATGLGSLRVKAPAGVIVKPEKQKVPVLLPGGSWTLSVRVQLTAKAKKSSTVAVTGTAPGTSAKGSLILKLAG